MLAFLVASVALLQGRSVPRGVTYKPSSPALNASFAADVKLILTRKLSDKELDARTSKLLFCFPHAWPALLKADPSLLKGSKIFSVAIPEEVAKGVDPMTHQGRAFADKKVIVRFWNSFQKLYTSKSVKLRPPTNAELSYYWAEIPYDINEPIFVAETPKGKFLFNVYPGGTKVSVIDLLPR